MIRITTLLTIVLFVSDPAKSLACAYSTTYNCPSSGYCHYGGRCANYYCSVGGFCTSPYGTCGYGSIHGYCYASTHQCTDVTYGETVVVTGQIVGADGVTPVYGATVQIADTHSSAGAILTTDKNGVYSTSFHPTDGSGGVITLNACAGGAPEYQVSCKQLTTPDACNTPTLNFGTNLVRTTNPIFDPTVFDYQFYNNFYPDLYAAGLTEVQAAVHWQSNGVAEGRRASVPLAPVEYLQLYSDLRNAYGTNYLEAIQHWVSFGKSEGREGSYTTHPLAFDYVYYLGRYADLRQNGISTEEQAAAHWLAHGISEGRQGSSTLNPAQYLLRYPDVAAVTGQNFLNAIFNFLASGYDQGRSGVIDTDPLVFNATYYRQKYPDLAMNGVTSDAMAALHFVLFGIQEGRQGCATFLASAYINRYPDLQKAFGTGPSAYLPAVEHFVLNGYSEGRNGAP